MNDNPTPMFVFEWNPMFVFLLMYMVVMYMFVKRIKSQHAPLAEPVGRSKHGYDSAAEDSSDADRSGDVDDDRPEISVLDDDVLLHISWSWRLTRRTRAHGRRLARHRCRPPRWPSGAPPWSGTSSSSTASLPAGVVADSQYRIRLRRHPEPGDLVYHGLRTAGRADHAGVDRCRARVDPVGFSAGSEALRPGSRF